MSSIVYGDKDFDVDLMIAVHIVDMYSDRIKPGKVHENNGTVIDWIDKARKIIDEKNYSYTSG